MACQFGVLARVEGERARKADDPGCGRVEFRENFPVHVMCNVQFAFAISIANCETDGGRSENVAKNEESSGGTLIAFIAHGELRINKRSRKENDSSSASRKA